ncbi:Phosphopantothenoylcysteine decarboxylase / Phosphopantothenate--cysteine ligase [Candidatus Hydrogenisulfobacillus filiaventi]|uniref:Coenzyme A biosynthesis bifunctional protein CoaBC n=1 Tax=Candidatus Hydrogenisulfobacillus filiaventi TaxID=2707344 RepID=A0A6F8ZGE5_9FIRM|nr:Phosphopantothenoylcysteine decarboxylase / Phosphopantothenate--cysteine ligase [Candidatus Hydrogenisulfobacillus filiaventi]
MNRGLRVVLGVGAGIAAYKAADLASRLVQDGHEVYAVLTPDATGFIGPLTFAALTHQAVGVDFEHGPLGPLSHVRLARWADVMVVAPATADLLARMAAGEAGNLLLATYLGMEGPVIVAPAMEEHMWDHPATQRNVERLRADGVTVVGPGEGHLASGAQGRGRMAEPGLILEAVLALTTPHSLEGRRVLVTAGPTWEFFDPVRLLTNPSQGRMGLAVAREARNRGAVVTLVHGPVTQDERWVEGTWRMDTEAVMTAEEMLTAVQSRAREMDVIVATAAVADFRPAASQERKLHKEELPRQWEMIPNPDVLRTVSAALAGAPARPLLVGFAAETDDLLTGAERKLREKGLDFVVGNRVGYDRGFGDRTATAVIIGRDGVVAQFSEIDKESLASELWDVIEAAWEGPQWGSG